MYPDLVDWVRVLLDGDFAVLVGVPRFTMQVFLDGDFVVLVGVLAFWTQGLLDGDFAVLVGVPRFTMQVFLDGDIAVSVGVLAFWMQGLLHDDIAVLVGAFSAFVVELFLCCAGGRSPKEKVLEATLFFSTVSQSQSCQVDYIQDHDQGSGEHGAVSSLPAGLGQASGRVDVPDGTKIEAAAQSPGT